MMRRLEYLSGADSVRKCPQLSLGLLTASRVYAPADVEPAIEVWQAPRQGVYCEGTVTWPERSANGYAQSMH
jgi:hypothetical protein